MAIALATLSGCDQTGNPPDGFFRMIHAAPGEGQIDFLLEEISQGVVNYKQGTLLRSLDSGPFDFNVEVTRPGDSAPTRIVRFPVDIVADQEHTFVLLDNTGTLSILQLEKPAQTFESDATQSEIQVLHVAPALGPVDVYVEAPSTNIAGATPLASLTLGEDIAPTLLAGGDYQLTLTSVSDATSVLFSSDTFTLDESLSSLALLVDGAGQGTALQSVLLVDPLTSRELFDENVLPGLRVIHAAATGGDLDVAVDSDFDNLLFAGISFGSITEFQTVANTDSQLTVTPAGNSGAMEFDETLDLSKGSLNTLVLTGEAGSLVGTVIQNDFRGLTQTANLRIYNGHSVSGLDVYLVPPGTTDLSDESPALIGVPVSGVSFPVPVLSGNFDLVFTQVAADTIIGGPVSVSLSNGTSYSVATFDDPAGTGFTITLLDGFN